MVAQVIPAHLRPSLADAIRRRRAEFNYLDDVVCFERLYAEFADYSALIDRFADAFPSSYQFVRMYHCCRPVDTDSYYKHGIRVLDAEFANAKFRDAILGNPRFPAVTLDHLELAFREKRNSCMRNGYVYFGLDDRYLLDHCKDYLQNGSEYAQSLAEIVDRNAGTNVSAYLKETGTPTVFEATIPMETFGGARIRELGPEVLFAWAYDIANGTGEAFHMDLSIELDHDLVPAFVVRHYNADGSAVS